MNNELAGMYRIMFGLVDVRDAADAHLRAVKSTEAANNRILLCSESLWCREIGLQLAEEFNKKGYNFSTEEVKFCMMRFLGSFFSGEDAEMKEYKSIWGKPQDFNN